MFIYVNDDSTADFFNFADEDDETVIVLGKYQVPRHLYASIKVRVEEIRPHLIRDAYYTSEDLLGTAYWADLSEVSRRLATCCLEDLAREGFAQLAVIPSGKQMFYLY